MATMTSQNAASAVPTASSSVVSIPMLPDEEALKTYQSKLQPAILGILTKAGVKWTTLSITHRGTNAQRPDLCPPTIIITTFENEPLKQEVWKGVERSIRAEIAKQTHVSIQVAITQGIPTPLVRYTGGEVFALPYPSPRPVGYSLGVIEEKTGIEDKPHSGTLGGYGLLAGTDMQFAVTCNHVGNPLDVNWNLSDSAWSLESADGGKRNPREVVHHKIVSPSNQDNVRSVQGALTPLFLDFNGENNDTKAKKARFRNLAVSLVGDDPPPSIEVPTLITGSLWDKFANYVDVQDYYVAMQTLPRAQDIGAGLSNINEWIKSNELPSVGNDSEGDKKKKKLYDDTKRWKTFYEELIQLWEQYTVVWNLMTASGGTAQAVAAEGMDRGFGETRHASGLVFYQVEHEEHVMDWALVSASQNATNAIPQDLQELAKKYNPSCPLAKGSPVTGFAKDIKSEKIVFKMGRTTGATMGQIDTFKALLSDEALKYNGLLPSEGTFDGREIIIAEEWNIRPLEMSNDEPGKPVPSEKHFSKPGDSGAWVVNENSELVGMVFLGLPSEQQTFVEDINLMRMHIHEVTGQDMRLVK